MTRSKEERLQIANEILKQIGRQTQLMLGVREPLATEKGLRFRIGRNAKNVNMVEIELEDDDTYTVVFSFVSRKGKKVLATERGAHASDLHSVIENHTGMRTRL